jgi:octaprenyl-diphosphate synthase
MTDPKEELLNVIRREANKVENAMRADLEQTLVDSDPLLKEALDFALFGGGKRIRPVLAIFSHWVCDRQNPQIYLLAAAFEYLHVATLVHDDVIDHAPNRRGRPALWKQYTTATAILAGDWLHAHATHLIGSLSGKKGLDIFCHSNISMVDGEFLQLRSTADPATSEADYFAVIHRKTALLIGSTCGVSALFSNADEKQQQGLTDYGLALGSAFQVIDDLLDYVGDTKKTGKGVGNDFIEGKMTLPLISGMGMATDAARQEMIALLQGERQKEENFLQIRTLIENNGGFTAAHRKAEELIDEALGCLTIFTDSPSPTTEKGLSLLRALAGYILQRDR